MFVFVFFLLTCLSFVTPLAYHIFLFICRTLPITPRSQDAVEYTAVPTMRNIKAAKWIRHQGGGLPRLFLNLSLLGTPLAPPIRAPPCHREISRRSLSDVFGAYQARSAMLHGSAVW